MLARQPAFSFVSCPLRPRPARLFPAMTSPESRGGPLSGVGAAGGNVWGGARAEPKQGRGARGVVKAVGGRVEIAGTGMRGARWDQG